ncbi:hypothetical protein E3U55_06795 [Filobacillus milosensis]|uniref:Uncharacterized protein n=1 Tax=Filobacillus milosensis TaxID=94137 RepID=A0A4Y8IQH0_9BACI|nr:hypothetical protein [Filobacillus milosensis]TFB22943.1 hypothetical protein E3U55_06795 [Filobacillus milosensis]
MRFFSRFLITVGVLIVVGGVIALLFQPPNMTNWQQTVTYVLFQSSARVAWVFGGISLLIGGMLAKKAKKKGRIFY